MKIILEDHRSDKDLLEIKESIAHLHKRIEEIEVGVSALHEWMSTMEQPYDVVGLIRRMKAVEERVEVLDTPVL